MIPAFHGSAIQEITCEPNCRNALTIVEMMFKSFTHNMNSPTNTPTNRDNIVSFVMNAKPIATSSGSNVNIPKRTELSAPAGVEEIHKDNIKRAIIVTAVIKPIRTFLFIITPFFLYFNNS